LAQLSNMIRINQKFQRCTFCGKMIPLKTKPIVLTFRKKTHTLCSKECIDLIKKYSPN